MQGSIWNVSGSNVPGSSVQGSIRNVPGSSVHGSIPDAPNMTRRMMIVERHKMETVREAEGGLFLVSVVVSFSVGV